jgi:glucose/arabinose dehydrogenase
MLERARTVLLLAYVLLVAACGGGGGSPGWTIPPGASGGTGMLQVVADGLPAGVNAALRVTGPNGFARDLANSQTLANLAPGTYDIAAGSVAAGTATYAPTPPAQSVVVTAGASVSAAVVYASEALSLTLAEFARNLDYPTYLAAPPGDERIFILERRGRIRLWQGGAVLPLPWLDISARVATSGEGGLLSIAFDPRFASNGYFYLYYTDPQQNIVVERFSAGLVPDRADPTSGLVILRIAHPLYLNHFGGQVAFGPDGYLYLGTGDGGGAGDPQGNAQNLASLLGKLLRVDVSAATPGQPYTIPPTNPYASQSGRRPEIWAHGLRNPWRFSVDGNVLYVADVGQGRREEVNIAPAAQAGLNYGWNIMEGSLCYNAAECNRGGLTLPAFEYDHGTDDANGCSIVGGAVYRGRAIPELQGRYFYSDYCGGYLKSLYASGGAILEQRDWATPRLASVVSFGQDGQGELYLVTAGGTIYKIGRATTP